MLIGHQFTPYFSVQAHYLRPVQYLAYRNINGADVSGHVWMHFGGVTAKTQVPLGRRASVYGEAGLGLTSRRGFDFGTTPVVRDAHFANALLGGGIEYHVNRKWDLLAGTLLSTGNEDQNQPRTFFTSGGFRYTMRELPADVVERQPGGGVFLPRAHAAGELHDRRRSATASTPSSRRRCRSSGVATCWYRGDSPCTTNRTSFTPARYSASTSARAPASGRAATTPSGSARCRSIPLFRFTLLRTRPADVYFAYSLAGPTYMSKSVVDGRATGNAFTFQDFMGMGFFLGPKRHLNVGVKINHYSNGNIFTENAGVKIPYTFNVGYTF